MADVMWGRTATYCLACNRNPECITNVAVIVPINPSTPTQASPPPPLSLRSLPHDGQRHSPPGPGAVRTMRAFILKHTQYDSTTTRDRNKRRPSPTANIRLPRCGGMLATVCPTSVPHSFHMRRNSPTRLSHTWGSDPCRSGPVSVIYRRSIV